jgi:WD40 repeat protein
VIKSARQAQWVDSISISPDGQRLAVALSSVNNTGIKDRHGFKFENSMLVVCELPSLKEIRKSVFDCPIEHVKFSPDRKLIGFVKRKYQGDLKDNVNINHFNSWDLTVVDSETLEERRSLSDFCGSIGFAFLKDSKRVLLGSKVRSQLKSEEQVFASYDIQTGDKIAAITIPRGPARHIQATADEQLFLIYDAYGGARLLTFPGGEERTDPPFSLATRGSTGPACLSSDLRYVLRTEYRQGTGRPPSAHLWDMKESREAFRYEEKTGTYTARAFSPSGNQFALGTGRGWNHELGKVLIFDVP